MSRSAEEVFPMVGEFSESEFSPISAPSFSTVLSQNDQPPYLQFLMTSDLLQEIISTPTETEIEVLEKISMHERNMGIACGPNDRKKWMVKKLQMEGYQSSLCTTSWVSTFGRSRSRFIDPSEVLQYTGKYEYIDVMVRGGNDQNPTRLIVDMDFRSQFVLARPTPSYMELANIIPSIFVGTEEKLEKIVSLICSAMKRSLRESGLYIPPWRKTSYMQSKWLSKNCKKVSV
ncbi:hypothetical protein F2P56_033740 [Juglans regia]|uniref:Uncharacterized protein n=2 Tax=Juglans regia TaxID=51240 RepID=A0A833T8L7_JUGRE|nr:uncharacterized protein LOC109012160 [Juglans regia]KAF5444620.1 hypothetical protein F2P56_033740 [Juglans regia]